MHPLQRRVTMRIKRHRTERRLTQGALAQRAGLTRQYLKRLDVGRPDKPAKALGVTVKSLVGSRADRVRRKRSRGAGSAPAAGEA